MNESGGVFNKIRDVFLVVVYGIFYFVWAVAEGLWNLIKRDK